MKGYTVILKPNKTKEITEAIGIVSSNLVLVMAMFPSTGSGSYKVVLDYTEFIFSLIANKALSL